MQNFGDKLVEEMERPELRLIFKESRDYATGRMKYQADLDDGTGLGATLIGPTFDKSLVEPIVLAVNTRTDLLLSMDRIACALADVTTSKDFDLGNAKKYLDHLYREAKHAITQAGGI